MTIKRLNEALYLAQRAKEHVGWWGEEEAFPEMVSKIDRIVEEVKGALAEAATPKYPLMGYGRVAIGGGLQPDGTYALVYLDLGEEREIDADTTDVYPINEALPQDKILACIKFKNKAAIQQSIDVLTEMLDD